MTLRRTLMGLAAATLCGTATAANSPGHSLPEGRELDPVARDFFFDERPAPSAAGEPIPSRAPSPATGSVVPSFLAGIREALFAKLTIQLGTVKPFGGPR